MEVDGMVALLNYREDGITRTSQQCLYLTETTQRFGPQLISSSGRKALKSKSFNL